MAAGCRSRGVCLAYVFPRDGWPLTPRGRRWGLDLAGSCHGRLQVLRVWGMWPGMEKRKVRPGANAAWLTIAWLATAWRAHGRVGGAPGDVPVECCGRGGGGRRLTTRQCRPTTHG